VHAVVNSDRIYNGVRDVTADIVIEELAAIDPLTESLLVVGHNPTVLDLAWALAKGSIPEIKDGDYPLGAAVVLRLEDGVCVDTGPYKIVRTFVPKV
jgi:phosphohistidine phosphatase SixA